MRRVVGGDARDNMRRQGIRINAVKAIQRTRDQMGARRRPLTRYAGGAQQGRRDHIATKKANTK